MLSLFATHGRYASYVFRHKVFVFFACLRLGVPLHQAILHDWSKFLPDEWRPYARHFYGPKPIQRDATGYYHAAGHSDAFDRAWLHHQNRNPHHWQYWVLNKDDGSRTALAMPDRFVREMVADWIGAGRAQGTPDTKAWYLANQGKMVLHPDTRERVKQLLGVTS